MALLDETAWGYSALIARARPALQVSRTAGVGVPSGQGGPAGKLARGTIAAFIVYAVGAGLTYGSQLVLARMIGADGYGVYAYVFAWMTVLAYISALGFDVSLLRFVPAYLAPQAFALLRGVIRLRARRRSASERSLCEHHSAASFPG